MLESTPRSRALAMDARVKLQPCTDSRQGLMIQDRAKFMADLDWCPQHYTLVADKG